MDNLKQISKELLYQQHFDCLAVGVVDFKSKKFESFEISPIDGDLITVDKPEIYFDLASVSKVFNLAASYLLHEKSFDEKLISLIEHTSGLPSWGLLDHGNWKDLLMSYEIKPGSSTLYSDFGALRLMLELELSTGKDFKSLISTVWDKELLFWKDLQTNMRTVDSGFRGKTIVSGEVHDPNAYVINSYTTHAGLFATVDGVCRSIINLNENTGFVDKFNNLASKKNGRFFRGWDTVEDPNKTLAGKGCSEHTFGHLGFVGTSLWIDPQKQRASVILTNGTKNYWYDKEGLNHLRRTLGEKIWQL